VTDLRKKALLLSYFTVGYNVIECAIAILAGYLAGSIALVGFGLDSFAESLSGGVIIWRFARHEGVSEEEERIERKAIRIVGYTFFALAAYICYESLETLVFGEIPSPSLLGIFLAIASIIIMPILFYIKYRTGKSLKSPSLMADSKQTLACSMLSVALLIGLGLNYWFGIWQADPIIALVIVVFLIKEGYQTLKEDKLCSCASCGYSPPSVDD